MKIAVTCSGAAMNDPVDPRFGRAKNFLLVDSETGSFTTHDNAKNLNAPQGAGIQAAESVSRIGAQAVITGNVGPKAFRALQAAGIKIFLAQGVSVAEAIKKFKAGELEETTAANVDGHWA